MIRAILQASTLAMVLLSRCGAEAAPGTRCITDADCGDLVCDVGVCQRVAAEVARPSARLAPTGIASAPRHLEERFRIAVGARVVAAPILLPNGSALVVGVDGHAFVVRSDGTLAIERRLGVEVRSTPAVDLAGTIAVGGMDGVVRLLDLALGETARVDLGDPVEGPIALLPNGAFAVPTRGMAIVTALGTELVRIPTATRLRGGAVAHPNGDLVFATTEGELVSADLRGRERFRVPIGANADGNPAVLPDGSLLVGTDLAELVRVSETGTVLGRATAALDFRASPLARTDGSIVGISLDGVIHVYDRSLLESRSVTLGHRVTATPTNFSDGSLLIATLAGTLHGFDATFASTAEATIGSPIVTPPLPLRNGTVLVASDDGFLRGFR